MCCTTKLGKGLRHRRRKGQQGRHRSAYVAADVAVGIWSRATEAARALQGPNESRIFKITATSNLFVSFGVTLNRLHLIRGISRSNVGPPEDAPGQGGAIFCRHRRPTVRLLDLGEPRVSLRTSVLMIVVIGVRRHEFPG